MRHLHLLLASASLIALAAPVTAAPKVCGSASALGGFDLAKCPELKDDGVAPDEVAGDGISSAEVRLDAADFLFYKILPEGVYNQGEITQASACAPAAAGNNSPRNIVVPKVAAGPARFYFDSRDLSGDPSYAPLPAGARGSGGDTRMVTSPSDVAPRWVAVGDFQASPFDLSNGTVALAPSAQQPSVLSAEIVLAKPLPANWQWKVVEDTGSYTTARKYGLNGWAYPDLRVGDNCDNQAARMATPLSAGTRLRLRFASHLGRLQAEVLGDSGADMTGPAAPDLASAGDLTTPPGADLAGARDLAATPDGGGGALPGIRCNLAGGIGGGRAYHAGMKPGMAPGAALVLWGLALWRRRRRAGTPAHRDC